MSKTVIFGATSAIALAAARRMAEAGHSLFLIARDAAKLEAVRLDLETRGARIAGAATADLNDYGRHAGLVTAADEALGGLTGALVAHGALGDQRTAEHDFTAAHACLETNFLSAASLVTHLANRLETRRGACIAVISSVAGDRGRPSNYVYGSAKAGLDAFLSGVRARLAKRGVAVVTVKPGFTDSPMTAHITRKGPLWASADRVGTGVFEAMSRRRDVVYLPWFWGGIMAIIRAIPERLFKRLSL